MKRPLLLVAALALLLGAAPREPDAASTATDQSTYLEGTWDVDCHQDSRGHCYGGHVLGYRKVRIRGRTMRWENPIFLPEKFELDSSCWPKRVDFVLRIGRGEELRCPGIYELKGDRLKICYVEFSDARPTKFPAFGEKGFSYYLLKRVKR